MRIEKWISWAEANDSPQCEDYEECEQLIIDAIRHGEAPTTGTQHQQSEVGVPLFTDGTVFQGSQRVFGQLIYRAINPNDPDPMGYINYAWDLGALGE